MTKWLDFTKSKVVCRACESHFDGSHLEADWQGWHWSSDNEGYYWLCPACFKNHLQAIKHTIYQPQDTWGT